MKEKDYDPKKEFKVFKDFIDHVNCFDREHQNVNNYQISPTIEMKYLSFEGLFKIIDYIK